MSDNKVVLMYNIPQPNGKVTLAIKGVDLQGYDDADDADKDMAILYGPDSESRTNLIESIKQRCIKVPGVNPNDADLYFPNPGETGEELFERCKDLAMAFNS